MEKDKKELIKRYLNGELNSAQIMRLRELQAEDEGFKNGFELRKAFSEIDEIQTNMQIHEDVDAFFLNEKIKKKWYFIAAASLIGVLSVLSALFFKGKEPDTYTMKVNLFETNLKVKNGSGFGEVDSIKNEIFVKQIAINFIKVKSTLDSSYLIVNSDSANLYFRNLPQKTDVKSIKLIYNFNTKMTNLIMNTDTFNLIDSRKITKLIRK